MTDHYPHGALVLALAPEGQDCLIGRVIHPPRASGAYVLRNWDWAYGRWTGPRRVPQRCVVGDVPPNVSIEEIAFELLGKRNKGRNYPICERDPYLKRSAVKIIRRHGGRLR